MNTIRFRIAAKTDKGLVRSNNEDNLQAASDLTLPQMRWVNNEICSLGDKGALLVVADGMGGMNAGEVASEIAIQTVKEWFAPENITSTVMSTRFNIERFMNDAIVAADAEIKRVGKERPETRGMGTTIVIGWLLGGKLYVSWCGDSRAYVYNPEAGLHQISKDHSYVQSLVDKGKISHEDAFDYPDSNIITRSLSDGGGKAKPESLLKPYEVCDKDVILLCTDGLSGMLRDREMEAVVRANEHNVDECADALINAACDAGGADNITVCLCQILQGGGALHPEYFAESDARLMGPATKRQTATFDRGEQKEPAGHTSGNTYKKGFYALLALVVVLFAALAVGGYFLFNKDDESQGDKDAAVINVADKCNADKQDDPEADPADPNASTDDNPSGDGKDSENGIPPKNNNNDGDRSGNASASKSNIFGGIKGGIKVLGSGKDVDEAESTEEVKDSTSTGGGTDVLTRIKDDKDESIPTGTPK